MLVLSRRPDEKIILPTVPAVIKVIATQTGLVRLGIEAPAHVPILREELYEGEGGHRALPAGAPEASAEHVLRNRLNNLILGLALLRVQLHGSTDLAVRKTLNGLEEEAQAMRLLLSGAAERTLPQLVPASA